jgi:hypothetical protein
MPYINEQKFKSYVLDTISSFKNRIASSLNTLPEYLIFEDDLSLSEFYRKDTKITVKDLLLDIKESAEKNLSIIKLIDKVQNIDKKLDIKEYVLPIWFAYNKKLKRTYKTQGDFALDDIITDITSRKIKNLVLNISIKDIWRNKDKNIKKLQDRIDKNKKTSEEAKKKFKSFDKTSLTHFTDFNTEYVLSTLKLESKDESENRLSLLELFNECILNNYVPFVTTQNFYKIDNKFIPSEEWTNSSSDSIIIKVASRQTFVKENLSNYTDTIIKIDDVSKDILAEIIVYTNTSEGNASKDEYTNRFLDVFKNLNLYVKQSTESKVSGIFYFDNKKIDKYILSDLVMNDELFSSLLKIDEREGATKNKTYTFIQFYHPSTGLIKANLSQKIANKMNRPSEQNSDLFPDKSFFISVKIKEATNTESILIFQNILGKLLTKYDEKAPDIIEFYSKYIKDFEEEEPEEIYEEEPKKISEEAPEIFVSNYTRNCPQGRMPSIVSEKEADIAKENDKSVVKFPRDVPTDSMAVKFPNDGENQKYYVCNNKQYKYVGLTKNKLKNSKKYPYVPCCFKTNQSNKIKFLKYYKGLDEENSVYKTKDVIKTDKILDNDRFGILPYNIENLFTFIYPNETYEYVRKGVFRNKHSFLNCVMEALDNTTDILSITDEDERIAFLIDVRNKLAEDDSNLSLCRQEMYDKNKDTIREMLKNPNEYLDPKLFIHLLEEHFKCNIFIFTRPTILSDGEMILPRHLQSYYKYKNDYPCIYIYEHTGYEQQCELIVKYNTVKQENPHDLFSYKNSSNIRRLFSKLKESYGLDQQIKDIVLPIPSDIKILSQSIDSYGKTRTLHIIFKDRKISLVTSPIQPLALPETEQLITKISLKIAILFIKELDIEIESQTIINNKAVGLNGILGNVKITIPIKETDKLDLPEEKEYVNCIQEISVLDQYNKNKKIARYLIEYTLWMYSKYLYDNDIKEMNDENISIFVKNFFKIDPSFKYGNISKKFKINKALFHNGLIVVHDNETLKRLIYCLRLNIQRNINIVDYHTREFIQNYYVDITDFTQHPNQVILFGEESIQHWINENNVKYTIHNYIQIGLNIPYFFKNILIDDRVYLAQNTSSIEKAYDISITWKTEHYNKGTFAESHIPMSFTLYSYKNAYNIKKHSIKTNTPGDEIKIIGYKIENKPYYTVLLKLS